MGFITVSNFIRFFSIIIVIFFNTISANTKHFKISYDPDFAPFSYLEEGKAEGLLIDYWKLWAEKNNYSLDFKNGESWRRALSLVKEKKVDFFLGTAPYENWMKSSDTFYENQTALFALKENCGNFDKKASYIIGIIGEDYKKMINKNFPNSQIIVYENYKTILNDFILKKIDLIYEDKLAIEYYTLQNKYFHKIRSILLLESKNEIKAISANKKLIKIFNKGLENLTKEELYDLESKWIINKSEQFYKNTKELILTKDEKEFIKNNIINISISENWYPFSFWSKENEIKGISPEIWEILSKKAKLKTKYNFTDIFNEELNSIDKKTNDVIFSAGKEKERKNYSIHTKPYASFPISIVTLKDENFIENMEFLFNKKILVKNNSTIHKMLKEKYPNLKLITVNTIKKGLEKVSNYEAYAYIDTKASLKYNIAKFEFNDLKISGNTGLIFQLEMILRNDSKTLQSILNKAIDTLEEEEINSIIERWENIHFEETFNYRNFWIMLILVLIIILSLIYINQRNIKKNKNLKFIVNERTEELKELNAHLEELVNQKIKELKSANSLLDEAQEVAHLGSFNYNIEKNKLFWSEEQYKIHGLHPNEIIPSIRRFLSYIHKNDRKKINLKYKELISKKSNKKSTFEYKMIMKDSTIKYIQAAIKITKFDDNLKPLIVVGTIFDITKVKYLELEKREKDIILAQKSKMAAMGEMLENIAHQWRQPLSVITTAATGLQLQLEYTKNIPEEILKENLISINNQSQYLSKTIDDFRNFFHQNREKEKLNIENPINKALYLINARIKNDNVKIVKDISNIVVTTLENELIQVLLNIINNAIDKLNEKSYEKYIFISTKVIEDKLKIYIKDNGQGIPPDIINRIFEPYFTTKHKAQGTGIGLYMSNEIITKHIHGTLKVNNVSYNFEGNNFSGALFIIEIPLI